VTGFKVDKRPKLVGYLQTNDIRRQSVCLSFDRGLYSVRMSTTKEGARPEAAGNFTFRVVRKICKRKCRGRQPTKRTRRDLADCD
jgi:hypothetical protein